MGNKTKANKDRFFYPPEFEKVMENLEGNAKFTADFMVNTGCRIFEAREFVKMPVPIFDDARKNITLTITKVKGAVGEKKPRPRILPLSSDFYKRLKRQIKTHKILSVNAFNTALKKACVKAEVNNPEELSSHNLRKTFASWMLSLGIDGFKLAKHIGNTPAELAKDYASNDVFNLDDKRIMVNILGDLPKRLLPDYSYFR